MPDDSVMLARVLELRAEIAAIEAEIEGMKIANASVCPEYAPPYPEYKFSEAANKLRNIANALHQIGYF